MLQTRQVKHIWEVKENRHMCTAPIHETWWHVYCDDHLYCLSNFTELELFCQNKLTNISVFRCANWDTYPKWFEALTEDNSRKYWFSGPEYKCISHFSDFCVRFFFHDSAQLCLLSQKIKYKCSLCFLLLQNQKVSGKLNVIFYIM